MNAQDKGPQTKYTYKFKFEASAQPKVDQAEIDRRALQEYINRLLGIPARSEPNTTTP